METNQEEPLLHGQQPQAPQLAILNAQGVGAESQKINADSDTDISKGEKQPNACRDWPFAFLFYCHLIVMIALGLSLGAPALARNTDDSSEDNESNYANDYEGFLKVALCSACFGFIAAFISLGAMMACPKQIIQFSLMFTIICSFLLAIAAFAAGSILGGFLGLILSLLSACYAYFVWSRIPFAAANLNAGLKAVNVNCGTTVVAYFMTVLGMVYTLIWILAVIGVYDKTADCDSDGECKNDPNTGLVFLMFVFYFWMQQVTQNTIHVTVAGTVGTWWFYPAEAASCCSKAIYDSFWRAITYSFGSICFGSLLVAIVQACRQLIDIARAQDDGNALLLCLLDCFLSIIEGLLRYFNKWAYVYVGVYGYSYLEAAKGVTDLFQSRGWTTIVTDDLVSNALSLVILVDGLITGLLGLALTQIDSWFVDDKDVEISGFLIAFIIGIVISGIMLGVVESAVNSVIVLFAEAPNEFSANHPDLYNEMTNAWREAYPLTCGF